MASEKQIAANRRNAQRSTGPKSLLGKMRSSRNARRHGFSGGQVLDKASMRRLNALKEKLLKEHPSPGAEHAADAFARAEIQISKIRAKQSQMLLDLSRVPSVDQEKAIRRLAALDRYDRYAMTERGRAYKEICQNEANIYNKNKYFYRIVDGWRAMLAEEAVG
jgi:hypothetical protein